MSKDWNMHGNNDDDSYEAPMRLSYEFTLPLGPTANRYWRTNPHSHRPYVSEEAVAYKQNVAAIARDHHLSPLFGVLSVTLRFWFVNANADLDNRLKVTLDSLNKIAYTDDVQITELHVYKQFVPPKRKAKKGEIVPPRVGYVIVTIRSA